MTQTSTRLFPAATSSAAWHSVHYLLSVYHRPCPSALDCWCNPGAEAVPTESGRHHCSMGRGCKRPTTPCGGGLGGFGEWGVHETDGRDSLFLDIHGAHPRSIYSHHVRPFAQLQRRFVSSRLGMGKGDSRSERSRPRGNPNKECASCGTRECVFSHPPHLHLCSPLDPLAASIIPPCASSAISLSLPLHFPLTDTIHCFSFPLGRSTPTWRERGGQAFCNACGLRLGKLGFRCQACGMVPHHADLGGPCTRCDAPSTEMGEG